MELLDSIISGSLNAEQFVELSVWLMFVAIVLILISFIVVAIFNRRSKEEKMALKIIKQVGLMREGKYVKNEKNDFKKESKNEVKEEKLHIGKSETSLKQMLMKKFLPVIENQIHAKVVINDFNARGENFIAQVSVQGHNLELVLDSTGKIIDYKNLDNK